MALAPLFYYEKMPRASSHGKRSHKSPLTKKNKKPQKPIRLIQRNTRPDLLRMSLDNPSISQ